ncbi:MAG: hypothetical protein WCY11_18295, partial [Novosphingobium sp.]
MRLGVLRPLRRPIAFAAMQSAPFLAFQGMASAWGAISGFRPTLSHKSVSFMGLIFNPNEKTAPKGGLLRSGTRHPGGRRSLRHP